MPVEKTSYFIDKRIKLGAKIGVCPRAGEDLDGKFEKCNFKCNQGLCPRPDKGEGICNGFYIITTPAGERLMQEVSRLLEVPVAMVTTEFGNGETYVQLPQDPMDKKVIIFNPGNRKPNDRWVEDLAMAQAARLARAKEIILFSPDGVYARQDDLDREGAAITSVIFMEGLQAQGVSRYVTIDYHSPKSKTNFKVSTGDDIKPSFLIDPAIEDICRQEGTCAVDEFVVVGPDGSSQKRLQPVAEHVGILNMAFAIKARDPLTREPKVVGLAGDVRGKAAIVIDDMIDSFKTADQTVEQIYSEGARSVYFIGTHPVLSGNAMDRIHASRVKRVYTSDVIDNTDKIPENDPVVKVFSAAEYVAHVICNLHCGDPLLSFR
jgi:ribose-phosphate pyrophosphokinase